MLRFNDNSEGRGDPLQVWMQCKRADVRGRSHAKVSLDFFVDVVSAYSTLERCGLVLVLLRGISRL